jgi:glycosyltransferase involved in cell wall biosynthesis
MNNKANLSIIVPLYNEEESVRPLYRSVKNVADALGMDYELLFVDDGSDDQTFTIASGLARSDKKLRVIKFRRNYGQTPAMAAGIDHATGDILVTMDGDLQNDPQDIPQFVDKVREGYDIVVGWRYNRKDKLMTRKIPSQIANWLIGKVTGIPIKDNGCSLKAFRASVIKQIPLYSEMHRFIPAMTSISGAKLVQIQVRHHARKYGTSKYGLSRIYKVLLDLLAIKTIVTFAAKPLLWFSALAVPAAVVSTCMLTYSVYQLFSGVSTFPVPLAGTGVLFGALTFVLVLSGMVAELVYKTGDMRLEELSSLTLETLQPQSNGDSPTAPCRQV